MESVGMEVTDGAGLSLGAMAPGVDGESSCINSGIIASIDGPDGPSEKLPRVAAWRTETGELGMRSGILKDGTDEKASLFKGNASSRRQSMVMIYHYLCFVTLRL